MQEESAKNERSTEGSLMDERIQCSDTTSYMNTPSKQLREEHEHTLDEVVLSLQRLTANHEDAEQDHIDADHYMGALTMLLARYINDPVITERVVGIVKTYREGSNNWWYA